MGKSLRWPLLLSIVHFWLFTPDLVTLNLYSYSHFPHSGFLKLKSVGTGSQRSKFNSTALLHFLRINLEAFFCFSLSLLFSFFSPALHFVCVLHIILAFFFWLTKCLSDVFYGSALGNDSLSLIIILIIMCIAHMHTLVATINKVDQTGYLEWQM